MGTETCWLVYHKSVLLKSKGNGVKGQTTHWFLEEEDRQSSNQWYVPQQRFHHHSQCSVKLDTEHETSQTLKDDVLSCTEMWFAQAELMLDLQRPLCTCGCWVPSNQNHQTTSKQLLKAVLKFTVKAKLAKNLYEKKQLWNVWCLTVTPGYLNKPEQTLDQFKSVNIWSEEKSNHV